MNELHLPSDLAERFRIDDPESFQLQDVDPATNEGFSKADGTKLLKRRRKRLAALQEMLYAQDRWSVLIVLQAMDAAGKDSLIEHVMGCFDPQGCEVHPFKTPNSEELAHDFLWRAHRRLPEKGRVGIFNRSYYEEVLVVRVHQKYLVPQKLPPAALEPDLWQERFKDIVAFEDYLVRNGTKILKFHLRLSPEEQRARFLARLEEPGKQWKFSMGDVEERKLWDDYMRAYEDMLRHTSHPAAPWYVVPADHKWYARLVVTDALIKVFESLDLAFPQVPRDAKPELEKVRAALEAQKANGDGPDGKPERAGRKRKQS